MAAAITCPHDIRPKHKCHTCALEYGRKRNKIDWERHKEKRRAKNRLNMRRRAGIVNPTSDTKSGTCPICEKYFEALVQDHAHKTGLVRGWLCRECNIRLGFYEDWALPNLSKIHKYLEQTCPKDSTS